MIKEFFDNLSGLFSEASSLESEAFLVDHMELMRGRFEEKGERCMKTTIALLFGGPSTTSFSPSRNMRSDCPTRQPMPDFRK